MSRVALITGAASGLGLATARAFAKDGWSIAVADLNVTLGEEVAKELQGRFYETNVTKWDSLSALFAQVWKDYNRLDFVFANAGIVEKFEFYKQQESDSQGLPPRLDSTVIDVNLQSVITTTYLAIHFFRKNSKPGGVLVMTASSGGLYPVPYLPMYAGAKHGVVGFMRSVEGLLSKEDIKAHCICPAAVRTNLIAKEEWDKMPQNTFVPIEKVVEAVQMLVNDNKLHGKTVELIQDRWSFRDGLILDDPAMAKIMTMSETPFDREKLGIAA